MTNPENKVFRVISIIIGLILLYSLFTLFYFVGSARFDILLNWKILLDTLPILIGIGGLIIFVASKFKRSGMLRIYMCFIVFVFPFFLIGIKLRMDNAAKYDKSLFDNWNFMVHLLITLLLTVCSCIGLWLLSKRRVPKLSYITIGGESFSEFAPAPASLRFVNRLADVLVIIYVLYNEIIDNHWLRHSLRNTGTGTLLLIEFLITMYYYMVLEGFFNISIGKCITGTLIVDEEGRRPAFGKIMGRTLCRYIPFEAFSYLRKNPRGWHDSISGTYVVKGIDENTGDTSHSAVVLPAGKEE